jgi:hypothetical protein
MSSGLTEIAPAKCRSYRKAENAIRADRCVPVQLKRVHKIRQADACLTENTLKCANNQFAMHRHCDAPIPLGHTNVRASLPDRREAQSLQRLDCLGSGDVTGQLHA